MIQQIKRFLISGVLIRLSTFILNFVLVKFFLFDIKIVYFFIQLLELIIGYTLNRKYVFTNNTDNKVVHYLVASVVIRSCDWAIYVLLVEMLHLHISLSQAVAMITMLVFKFTLFKQIFDKKSPTSEPF